MLKRSVWSNWSGHSVVLLLLEENERADKVYSWQVREGEGGSFVLGYLPGLPGLFARTCVCRACTSPCEEAAIAFKMGCYLAMCQTIALV